MECVRSQISSGGPSNGGIRPRAEEVLGVCRRVTLSQPRTEGEECGPSSNPACNSDCGPCAAGLECVKQESWKSQIQPRSAQTPSFCQLIEIPTDDFTDIPDLPDEHCKLNDNTNNQGFISNISTIRC